MSENLPEKPENKKKVPDTFFPRGGDILIYQTENGQTKLQVQLEGETLWLSQADLAQLYQTTKQNISLHIQNIYEEGELLETATVKEYLTVQSEGARQVSRQVKHYNLDMIISVGYRIKSHIATHFRQWATQQLREYIVKGFVLDDERLKQGNQVFGKDYFDELLERIREIRASERRFYQKITDIYALAADYDKSVPITKEFFAAVQNKLHWAITGKTAAEIIYDSADARKIQMGLTSWKHSPDGKILKSDVSVAKNYLNEAHIKELNRIVSAYLDLAENRAQRHLLTRMEDWSEFLNDFLELSRYPILKDKGKVSAFEAKLKAEKEYDEYRTIQDKNYISDFDKEIRRITGDKQSDRDSDS